MTIGVRLQLSTQHLVRGSFGCAAVVAIGAFLDWATASVGDVAAASVRGTHGDGRLTLGLALIGAALVAFGRSRSGVLAAHWLCAAVIALIAIIDASDISRAGNGLVDASVGIGLILTLLAGVVWTVLALLLLRRAIVPPDGDGERSD